MMLKIARSEIAKLGEISSDIVELFADLEKLRDEFEADAAKIIEEINEKKEAAREIMDDEANEAENYYDEKSEKWQESERGERYCSWKDELRILADAIAEDIESVETTLPEQPDWVNEIDECAFAEFSF